MLINLKPTGQSTTTAMTLVEVVVALAILLMTMAGLIYGYMQVNRLAEWSSMSLAAQSVASQGIEQARAAQWNSQMWPVTNGPGTGDELPPGTNVYGTNFTMDIPGSGSPFHITNIVTISTVTTNPELRQISSQCVWTFARTGVTYTNTVITYRAPDE